jgi:hypothetical protein
MRYLLRGIKAILSFGGNIMHFMKYRLKTVLLGATSVALSSMGHQVGAAIANGSFESPTIATNSWLVLAADDPSITGWTYEAPLSGASLLINGHGNGSVTILGPQDGNQFIEMAGGNTGHGPVYIEQTVTGLSVGTQYNVIGHYGWDHRPGAEHGRFKVTLVGTGDLLPLTVANNDQAWTQFDLPFTATATSHTIRFTSLGTNFGQQVALDNISVTPEPSLASVLAISGVIFGTGRVLRRRIGLH